MSCTHDCGCSAETRDARTDDWGHTSPPLPRPIDPEDVRVGMVVDIIDRARIRRVDDQRAWISDDEYTMLRRDGRSLWLVEDAPQVDEDHDLVEDIAEVISHAAPIDWDLSLERLDEDAADGLRHVARAIIERLRSQGRIEATR